MPIIASCVDFEAVRLGELVLEFVGHIEITLAIAHCQRLSIGLSIGIDEEGMDTRAYPVQVRYPKAAISAL
jgi:hypothetical protein